MALSDGLHTCLKFSQVSQQKQHSVPITKSLQVLSPRIRGFIVGTWLILEDARGPYGHMDKTIISYMALYDPGEPCRPLPLYEPRGK